MGSYWVGDGEGNVIEYDIATNLPVERPSNAVIRPAADDVPNHREMYKLNGEIIAIKKQKYGSKQTTALMEGLPEVFRVAHESLMKKLQRLRDNDALALNLRQELLLYRAVEEDAANEYGEALQLCEAICSSDDPGITPENRKKAMMMLRVAGQELLGVLNDVKGAVESAARVEYMTEDKFSGRAVRELLYGAVRILADVCGSENHDIVERFNTKLMTYAPAGGNVPGTTITPAMVAAEARDMDATVPLVE